MNRTLILLVLCLIVFSTSSEMIVADWRSPTMMAYRKSTYFMGVNADSTNMVRGTTNLIDVYFEAVFLPYNVRKLYDISLVVKFEESNHTGSSWFSKEMQVPNLGSVTYDGSNFTAELVITPDSSWPSSVVVSVKSSFKEDVIYALDTQNAANWADLGIMTISTTQVSAPPMTMKSNVAPTVNSPPDISYVVGTTGHTIKWIPADFNPFTYNVAFNGSSAQYGAWISGVPIEVSVDRLPLGNYTYFLSLSDTQGLHANDSVNVNVTLAPPINTYTPPPTSTNLFPYPMWISVACFALISSIRRKRSTK